MNLNLTVETPGKPGQQSMELGPIVDPRSNAAIKAEAKRLIVDFETMTAKLDPVFLPLASDLYSRLCRIERNLKP